MIVRVILCAATALLAACVATTGAAAAPRDGPGFAAITSLAAAKRLAETGALVPVFAFPRELGGPDTPVNIVYVPPATRDALQMVIGTLRRFAKKGLIDHMSVDPDYRGASVVPTALHYHATSRGEPGSVEPTIRIW
jgi:hypothetical protein